MHSETKRRRPGRARFLAVLLVAGCSQILGLEDGTTQSACTANEQCAPGFECLLGQCRNGCSSDQQCGEGSRCLKAIGTSACIPVAEGCGDMCPEGTRCVDDSCRTDCASAADCAEGQDCRRGLCIGDSEVYDPGGTGGTPGTPQAGSDAGGQPAGGTSPTPAGGMSGATTAPEGGASGNGGHGGEGMAAVGPALGEPCSEPGALGCNGAVSKLPLVCEAGVWKSNGACNALQNCDQSSGACEPILAECKGKAPGFRMCATGDLLQACGPDLVTIIDVKECDGKCKPDAGGDSSCLPPECGDGKISSNEECEDLNQVDTDACTNACLKAVCGDRIVRKNVEFCDDGNQVNTDDCANNCLSNVGVTANANGFTWASSFFLVPCYQKQNHDCFTVPGVSPVCPNQGAADYEDKGTGFKEAFQIGGTVGKLYDVTIHVAGVVSGKYYQNGTRRDGTNFAGAGTGTLMDGWYVGGSAVPTSYDLFKITVFDPGGAERQHYYLNSFPSNSGLESHQTVLLNYDATIVVAGGGTVENKWGDSNCHAIDNCGAGDISDGVCTSSRKIPNEPNQAIPAMFGGVATSTMSIGGAVQPWRAQILHVTITNVALHP